MFEIIKTDEERLLVVRCTTSWWRAVMVTLPPHKLMRMRTTDGPGRTMMTQAGW